MLSARKTGWLAIGAALIAVLLVSSFPFAGVPLGSKSSGNLIPIVSAQDDPCAGCDTVLDEIQLWQNRLDTLPSDADAVRARQALDAANNRLNRCITHGCDIGEPTPTPTPGSEEEPDPCLRGYETCVHVWEGNDKCLKECLERYNACKPAYEEYKILDEKYAKCLECIIRCDSVMPEKMVFGGLTAEEYIEECRENYKACKPTCKGDSECLKKCEKQYDDCTKVYDEYIASRDKCDAEYQSFCEGDAEILLQKVIAANNKYLPLSTDLTCTAITPTSTPTVQEIQLSLTANDGVVADGVSSVEVTVTLPTTFTQTVTLTDGKTTLTETAVNGEAVFTYVPDTEKLGLSPSNIPPEGVDITLTAETENGHSATLDLKVYRRPVLLVHGLWSTAKECWGHGKMENWLEESGFDVYTINYPSVQKYLLDIAKEEFPARIKEIKQDYLDKGVNCSKIDVVAHSMGGVIARAYINQYTELPKNEGKVDIKNLITVGTPHMGSRMPKVYFDALMGNFPRPLVSQQLGVCMRTTLQGLLVFWARVGPKGATLTYGPALHDLVPDSAFLTRLNKCPNNQYVDYHVIVGTDNWAAKAVLLEEQVKVEDYKINLDEWEQGDGVVPLRSARAPNRFPYAGYYVDEWHTELGSSPDVFTIVEKLLLEEKDQIPAQYREPQKTEIDIDTYYIPKDDDGPLFDIYVQKGGPGHWKDCPWYAPIEMGDRIKIVFNRWDPKDKEKMRQYLSALSHMREASVSVEIKPSGEKGEKQLYGDIELRLELQPNKYDVWPEKPPTAWFQFLSKSTIFIPSSHIQKEYSIVQDVYLNVKGDVRVIHDWGYLTSPDPEVSISIDDSNQIQVYLLEGNLMVNDWYNNSCLLTDGEMITQLGDEPISEPTEFHESRLEKWWTEPDSELQKNERPTTNHPPTASFSIMPENPTLDDTIVGVGASSSDPDGDALTYSWYFNGEYDENIGNLPNWTWPNPQAGEHTIKLVVDDGKGGSDEDSTKIKVIGPTPTDTPGFEIALLISAIVVALIVIKRRKHNL